MKKEQVPQWEDKGTYKEPTGGDNVRVPRLEVDAADTYIDKSGSDMTFTDPATGTVTLASLAAAGATTFIGLSDTDPTGYTGAAGKPVTVNAAETGLEFGSEIRLAPKASSSGPEGTIFYDSDDDHLWVATE